MNNQLNVKKADGQLEEYMHTKVIHTINNALAGADEIDIAIVEQLAEVVTYYLYKKENCSVISAREIFSIIKAALSSTGYEFCAEPNNTPVETAPAARALRLDILPDISFSFHYCSSFSLRSSVKLSS